MSVQSECKKALNSQHLPMGKEYWKTRMLERDGWSAGPNFELETLGEGKACVLCGEIVDLSPDTIEGKNQE